MRIMGIEKQKWLLSHEDRQWETGVWIGLTDYFTPGTLRWSINQDQPDYTNWAFGEPNDQIMSEHPGGACARFGADFEENDKAGFQIDVFSPACDWLVIMRRQSYWLGEQPS